MLKDSIYVKIVNADETFNLRASVLRDGRMENVSFDGDNDESTVHFAAMFYGSTIGIASLYRREPSRDLEVKREHAYQLRGMAVDSEYRGMDAGTKIIRYAEEHLRDIHGMSGVLIWCNARTSAVPFYEKMDFERIGEEFEIEGVGPHYLMYKTIS